MKDQIHLKCSFFLGGRFQTRWNVTDSFHQDRCKWWTVVRPHSWWHAQDLWDHPPGISCLCLCLKLCIRIPLSVIYKKSQRLFYEWSCFIHVPPFRSLPTSMIFPLVVRAPVGLSVTYHSSRIYAICTNVGVSGTMFLTCSTCEFLDIINVISINTNTCNLYYLFWHVQTRQSK